MTIRQQDKKSRRRKEPETKGRKDNKTIRQEGKTNETPSKRKGQIRQ